jgi:hypothetical protein
MTGTKGRLLLFFALLLGVSFAIKAQTINAASCNASDVQAAFNSVTSSTATVNIPACSGGAGWSTQVTLTVPSGSSGLTVLGAGSLTTTGGGDQTVIIDNYGSSSALLVANTGNSASVPFRLAGITFKGGSGQSKANGIVEVDGYSQKVRLDHMHWDETTYGGGVSSDPVQFNNWNYGVVDHSIFDTPSGSQYNEIRHYPAQWGSSSYNFGDGAWAAPSDLSGGDFLFIEDNIFNYGAIDDCKWGGRVVVRHNTINNAAAQTHGTGQEGSINGTRERSCRAFLLYDNTFNGSNFNAMYWSGGTGLAYGNTIASGYQYGYWMAIPRAPDDNHPQGTPPNGWGYCNGSTGWDQNAQTNGYACLDQPGRGQGDLLANDFPNTVDTTTGTISWPRQALEPIYEWLDTSSAGHLIGVYGSDSIVANLDYYAYTSTFTGTSGTGSGLLSARPSTCTPRVAYWATDTNTLYQCTATNTWTVYYTPYTYPHPLVSGTASTTTLLAPPTNLMATVQ